MAVIKEVTIENDKTNEVLNALDSQLKRALWAIGEKAEEYAKKDTPVDTGRLKNSISHQEDANSTYVGTNVEYAPYIEFGTSRGIPAHHMIQNAAENHSSEYKEIAKAALEG